MNRNLQLNRKQGGMTLMSFLVVLAVVGFAAYIGTLPPVPPVAAATETARVLPSVPGTGTPIAKALAVAEPAMPPPPPMDCASAAYPVAGRPCAKRLSGVRGYGGRDH